MANRFPLVLDTSDGNKIKEIPAGDNLDLRNVSINDVQDINSLGTINAAIIKVNGITVKPNAFTDLIDVPDSYQGFENYLVKVNDSGTGLEFTELGTSDISFAVQDIILSGDINPGTTNTSRIGTPQRRFLEIHSTVFQGSIKGFDGSTVFDATSNQIPYAVIAGTPQNLGDFTNDVGYITANQLKATLPEILGDDLTINVNNTGDLVGSVFADDSTLLVDAVAGKIRGNIENETINITSTVGDINITAADDIDIVTVAENGNINIDSADNINMSSAELLRIEAVNGIDITNTDNIYADVTNDIDFISILGSARLLGNGRVDIISETDRFNIEGTEGSISVESELIIFTNSITENNPGGTNNNFQFLQNGNLVAEAFQGDIFNDSGTTKLLDADQEELLCDVSFTPNVAGGFDTYWDDPAPTTVADALDRLASAIYAINGGTPV